MCSSCCPVQRDYPWSHLEPGETSCIHCQIKVNHVPTLMVDMVSPATFHLVQPRSTGVTRVRVELKQFRGFGGGVRG